MNITKEVSISSYGEYSSGNYGINAIRVDIGNLTLFFSYKTVIGFSVPGARVVSENLWGPTTGRHINLIEPEKGKRIPRARFEEMLRDTLEKYGVI